MDKLCTVCLAINYTYGYDVVRVEHDSTPHRCFLHPTHCASCFGPVAVADDTTMTIPDLLCNTCSAARLSFPKIDAPNWEELKRQNAICLRTSQTTPVCECWWCSAGHSLEYVPPVAVAAAAAAVPYGETMLSEFLKCLREQCNQSNNGSQHKA